MRIPISLFTIALSCVLSQAASINWTNHVANIQAETNAYVGTSVNVGAGFADARIYPDSGPAVTPFRLQSTALRLAGNIFEVSNGPGFLILSSDYTGLLSAPDLLLTGDASVQGAVLTDHVVATNGVVTGGLTNTSVSQLQGAVTANQVTSTNVITAQAGINTVGVTNTGVTVHTPSAIQTLAAGTIIAWDSSTERVAGSGGAVTLTGTPTIQTNNVPDGALITIRGTSDANTVTLQDYRLLAGTCIAMEMSTVTLANGGAIRFQWSAANQRWQQIDFSANSSQNHKLANLTVETNTTVGGTGGGILTITNGATATTPLRVNQAASATAHTADFSAGGTNYAYIGPAGQAYFTTSIILTNATAATANTWGVSTTAGGALTQSRSLVLQDTTSNTGLVLRNNSNSIFQSDGAGSFVFGYDTASPIATSIRAANGVGTDKVGSTMSFRGGQSTGTQTAGGISIETGLTGEASGSTANAYSTRAWYHPKFVALTHATATEIQKFSLAANKILGGHMCVTVYATNNVPHLQAITSDFDFAAVCTGTTIVPTLSTPNSTPQAADSGTLTLTGYTAVDNGDNTFSIKVSVSSDLASPTERAKVVVTALNGNAAVTITDP